MNDENLELFASSLGKLELKRSEAKANLEQLSRTKADEKPTTVKVDDNDPVAAAIARAKAKASGTADPLEEAQAKVSALKKRVDKSESKLTNAREMNDDNVEIFASSLSKLQAKLEEAEKTLAALTPPFDDNKSSKVVSESISQLHDTQGTPQTESVANDDPAAIAIAKAQAAMAGKASLSPQEKIQKDLISLEKRIVKTRQKLDEAKASGADTADILSASLEKLETKQRDQHQALRQL
jgi:electron transport complex protein RnfC